MAKVKKGDEFIARRSGIRRRVKSFTNVDGKRAARLERVSPLLFRGAASPRVTVHELSTLNRNYIAVAA